MLTVKFYGRFGTVLSTRSYEYTIEAESAFEKLVNEYAKETGQETIQFTDRPLSRRAKFDDGIIIELEFPPAI